MSIEQIQLGNTYLSLQRPAWTSTFLGCFSRSIKTPTLEQKSKRKKFAFIRTKKAIYDRVEIIKDLSSLLMIKFMKRSRTDRKNRLVLVTESIKKNDILERKNYKD